ncbi:hypothetical protein CBR_g40180 [Chara braunii]|uniref:Uncharacterized protein n=1 Tax=Chara braunii TaxID=69332 RepID=A0A388LTK0_CHABU|nr:hypothetical protein CBR_g40180 [Chara braunii]|eukprot:GBG85542.1 hypothetical protein CBR_g40180 [Chara braunii]
MMMLEREEEEKRKVVEEEAATEEEEEVVEEPLERRRGEERGEASSTKGEDAWMEKISVWVANLSLGEDEEALLYVAQEEREAFARHIAPEEQVLVAFHALKDEAASFAMSLARSGDCEHNMIAYSRLTPLPTFLKLLRERFANVTRGVRASYKLQTIHSRRRSVRALKAVMDDLVAVPDHGVTETQLVQLFYRAMSEPLRGHFFDKTQQTNITYDALSREVVLFKAKSMPVSTFWHKDLDKGKMWNGRTISSQVRAKDHLILTYEGGTNEVPYSQIEWGLEEEDSSVGQGRSYAAIVAGGRPQGRGGGQGQRGQALGGQGSGAQGVGGQGNRLAGGRGQGPPLNRQGPSRSPQQRGGRSPQRSGGWHPGWLQGRPWEDLGLEQKVWQQRMSRGSAFIAVTQPISLNIVPRIDRPMGCPGVKRQPSVGVATAPTTRPCGEASARVQETPTSYEPSAEVAGPCLVSCPETACVSVSLGTSLTGVAEELKERMPVWAEMKKNSKGQLVLVDVEVFRSRVGALIDLGATCSYFSRKGLKKLRLGLKVQKFEDPIVSVLADSRTMRVEDYVEGVQAYFRLEKDGKVEKVLHSLTLLLQDDLPFDRVQGMDWGEAAGATLHLREHECRLPSPSGEVKTARLFHVSGVDNSLAHCCLSAPAFARRVRKEQLEDQVFVVYVRPVTEPKEEDSSMDPTIAKLLEEFKDLTELPTGVVSRPI